MNEKVKQAFITLKEFLRMTDDDENPTNAFYHKEELDIIEQALNDYEENEKELKTYKDIEKELGIKFETICKALKNGIYFKINEKIWRFDFDYPTIDFNFKAIIDNPEDDMSRNVFMFEDYGDYWALTEEELCISER